jgi:hypothetical protein
MECSFSAAREGRMLNSLMGNALLAAVGLLLLFWQVRGLVLDLKFYKANNWDWNKNSGRTMQNGALPTFGKVTGNRERVLFGFPFTIGTSLLVLAFHFFFWWQGVQ